MPTMRGLAERHPFWFVIVLFIVNTVLAFPFVIAFNVLGLDREPLRLIIPIATSLFMFWVVWRLGWFDRAGLTGPVKNVHLYWYPVLIAFVPVALYGTVQISAGPLAFYIVALLFTGISEELLARGVILSALLPRGKWTAVLFAAVLFSVGHVTNLLFEDFDLLRMGEVLLSTFAFAVLYGAMFLRTKSLWPLIILHALDDYLLVTSGTAGPFVVERISIALAVAIAIAHIVYGTFILMRGPRAAVDEAAAAG